MGADSRKQLVEGRIDFGNDVIETKIRERVREMIEEIVEDELDTALGARSSERVEGRRGYRHGVRERSLTTSLGATKIAMPRARIRGPEGPAASGNRRRCGGTNGEPRGSMRPSSECT